MQISKPGRENETGKFLKTTGHARHRRALMRRQNHPLAEMPVFSPDPEEWLAAHDGQNGGGSQIKSREAA
jgi:hypothetical protein